MSVGGIPYRDFPAFCALVVSPFPPALVVSPFPPALVVSPFPPALVFPLSLPRSSCPFPSRARLAPFPPALVLPLSLPRSSCPFPSRARLSPFPPALVFLLSLLFGRLPRRLDTFLRLPRRAHAVPTPLQGKVASFAKQVKKIRLLKVLFVNKFL